MGTFPLLSLTLITIHSLLRFPVDGQSGENFLSKVLWLLSNAFLLQSGLQLKFMVARALRCLLHS